MGRARPARSTLAEMLAVVLLVGPATACILVVKDDPDKLDKRCHFAGDDTTACGICIANNCQINVDACCGSKACRDDSLLTITKPLDLLDQCSTGTPSACKLPTFSDESSTEGAMFTCIESACGADCAVSSDGGTLFDSGRRDGASSTSKTRCTKSTDSCYCYGDPPYNDTPCDIATPASAVCCANLGWPDSGLRCSCNRWTCRTTSSGCECGTLTTGPTATCDGLYCCSSLSTCKCSDTPCSTFDTPVPSCAAQYQECSSSDDTSVSSCAVSN